MGEFDKRGRRGIKCYTRGEDVGGRERKMGDPEQRKMGDRQVEQTDRSGERRSGEWEKKVVRERIYLFK